MRQGIVCLLQRPVSGLLVHILKKHNDPETRTTVLRPADLSSLTQDLRSTLRSYYPSTPSQVHHARPPPLLFTDCAVLPFTFFGASALVCCCLIYAATFSRLRGLRSSHVSRSSADVGRSHADGGADGVKTQPPRWRSTNPLNIIR